jgi:hypothetical protein
VSSLFVFCAIWVAFGLAPLLKFRVAADKTPKAMAERVERFAVSATDRSAPLPVSVIVSTGANRKST